MAALLEAARLLREEPGSYWGTTPTRDPDTKAAAPSPREVIPLSGRSHPPYNAVHCHCFRGSEPVRRRVEQP
jgi:hypothetical protein